MRRSAAFLVLVLLCFSAMLGCGGFESDHAVAPSEDELIQFLNDNPEAANEEDTEEEAEDA